MDSKPMKFASMVSMLAGLWFFVSPWIYGMAIARDSWNNWIVGMVVVILAAFRLGYPMRTMALSWMNCVLGIWAFASPWIYRYTDDRGMFINSLCVGVALFVAAISSATNTPHTQHPAPTHS